MSNDTNAVVVARDIPKVIKQFVTFRIQDELFGVDILDVKEVTPMIEITPVFHAPEEVMGYMNIRGEIHLVLNMRYLLGFPSTEPTPNSRVVIFKQTIAEPFGIMVDRVGDVLEVSNEQIETDIQVDASSISSGAGSQMVTGVCKLEKELLVLLNAHKFLVKQQ